MVGKKSRRNTEFESSDNDLDFLKFGMETIRFKERWIGGVQISCDPDYLVKAIAQGLNSLYPPLRKPEDISSAPAGLDSKSSKLPESPNIIDIANMAYDIWMNQFSRKMKEAFLELFTEIYALTVIELSKKFPDRFNTVDPVSLLNIASKGHYSNRRRRLKAPKHGGDRRKRNQFNAVVQPILFAYYVQCLRLLWKYISDFVEEAGYSSESINKLKRTKVYELLSKDFPMPKGLLNDILSKPGHTKDREYQPLGFAVRHASLLLGIKKNAEEDYTFNTLLALYKDGRNKAFEYRYHLEKHLNNPVVTEMISRKQNRSKNKSK